MMSVEEEADNQALEGLRHPINDVLLSSSSVAKPTIIGPAPPVPKPRARSSKRTALKLQIVLPVGKPMEINGVKHEPAPPELMAQNICHLCNKQFVYSYALKKHLANHKSEVFACGHCSKTFKQQSTLTTHKASHAQLLPFTCDTCHKSFNRISTLKSHRRIHSGAKPFVCHVCNKAFHQKGNLKNHLNIHTNERPYRCNICSRGFNQMSNLVCHKKNTHRATSAFYCQYCEMQFSRAETLASHEMEVHLRPARNPNMSPLETQSQLVQSQMEETDSFLADENNNDIEVVVCDDLKTDHTPICQAPKTQAPPTVTPPVVGNRNCQMVYEKTENHRFFSKFSVIELPQKIDTLEMRYAAVSNKTPFAMLHFDSDAPCLVEIVQQRGMSILRPIKKHELGNFTFSEPDPDDASMNGKIVITIVATILQSFENGDNSLVTVKSPEVVSSVKLLVDSEVAAGQSKSASLANRARAEELRELKNKITIAMTDCTGSVSVTGAKEMKQEWMPCKEESLEY